MLWKSSLAGVGLLASAALAGAAYDAIADRALGQALGAIASDASHWRAGQIAADPWRGQLRVSGASFRNGDLAIHAGSLTLGFEAPLGFLIAPAQARTNSASAEDVTIETGFGTYRIKRIDLAGTALSKVEFAQILDPNTQMTAAERFGKLSAAAIAIPELVAETRFGAMTQKIVYHDVSLTEVVNGKIAAASAAGASFSMSDQNSAAASGAYGPMKANNIDLVLAASIMTGTRSEAIAPKLPLYESYAVDGFYFSDARQHVKFEVKTLAGRGVRARPPRIPWGETKDPDQSAFEPQKRGALLLADVADSFEFDEMDANDVRLATHQDDKPVNLSIAHVGLRQFSDDRIGEFGIQTVALGGERAKITIGDIVFRGLDLKNLREALRKAAPNDADEPPEANARAAISSLEEIVVNKVDVEIAGREQEGSGAAFMINRFAMHGPNQKDGLPTQVTVALDHLTCGLGQAEDGAFKDLAAMGYAQLDLSGRIEAAFDEVKQELAIGAFSLEGAKMGILRISGLFGNVSKDLLSPSRVAATSAALGARLKKIDLRIENTGLLERAIEAQARSQNKSAEELRQTYATAASILLPAALDNGPAANAIGAAFAKFVADPKSFRLVAVAPDGLGAADLKLLQTPGALLRKLEIEVSANQ